jgi:hypothetical protein
MLSCQMQTFIRLPNGKTITIEFDNGLTTIHDLKMYIADKEDLLAEIMCQFIVLDSGGKFMENSKVLTREEFGDKMFNFFIQTY